MPVPSTPTRPSSPSRSVWWRPDELGHNAGAALARGRAPQGRRGARVSHAGVGEVERQRADAGRLLSPAVARVAHPAAVRSEEHTSELQSPCNLVCRLLLEKKKTTCPDETAWPHSCCQPRTNSATAWCRSSPSCASDSTSPSCPSCPARRAAPDC